MGRIVRENISTYIGDCDAYGAYDHIHRYPTESRGSGRSRRGSYGLPLDMGRLRLSDKYKPRRRSSTISPSSEDTGLSRTKSVRFDDGERPSTQRRADSSSMQNHRPKTFSQDAPPAAISESARDTARRLYDRKPDDGGRPAARPTVQRSASTRTLNTTRAEAGTTIGRRSSGRSSRHVDHENDRRRHQKSSRPSKRR